LHCGAVILETRFVDVLADHGGLRHLHGLIRISHVIALRDQIKRANAGVPYIGMREVIRDTQSIILIELIIHARIAPREALRRR